MVKLKRGRGNRHGNLKAFSKRKGSEKGREKGSKNLEIGFYIIYG